MRCRYARDAPACARIHGCHGDVLNGRQKVPARQLAPSPCDHAQEDAIPAHEVMIERRVAVHGMDRHFGLARACRRLRFIRAAADLAREPRILRAAFLRPWPHRHRHCLPCGCSYRKIRSRAPFEQRNVSENVSTLAWERCRRSTIFVNLRWTTVLISYAIDLPDAYRQAAMYARRILKGANPPNYRCCNRPSSNSLSILRPPKRWASPSP